MSNVNSDELDELIAEALEQAWFAREKAQGDLRDIQRNIKPKFSAHINNQVREAKIDIARYFGTIARLEQMPEYNDHISDFEKGKISAMKDITETSDSLITELNQLTSDKEE